MQPPVVVKQGTVEFDMMEATPFVFKNRLYRFEYIHDFYHGNSEKQSYFRIVDAETRKVVSRFVPGGHLGSAFVWNDTVVVTYTMKFGDTAFYQTESTDLTNWTPARKILTGPGWETYNTSICRAGDRFIMVFELGKPEELVGQPFTMFFAESTDLREWKVIPEAVFGRGAYCGAPLLRYFDGYFYFFYLFENKEKNIYEQCVARSSDMKEWVKSPLNPVLTPSADDMKERYPGSLPAAMIEERLKNAVNINNSDIDMCEWQGQVIITYSWGNQWYKDNLAEAVYDGSEAQFCRAWFPAGC